MAIVGAPAHGDPVEILAWLRSLGVRIIAWDEGADGKGDAKGPREPGWPAKVYEGTYEPGKRYGVVLGTEIETGRFAMDVDMDWAGGAAVAAALLPSTGLAFGRASKPISHALYSVPEPIPSQRFEDVDGSVLLELRCAKADGTVGLQTMAPPSVWSRGTVREELMIIGKRGPLAPFQSAEQAIAVVRGVAIAIILAKHMGKHGFGHEMRLAWAGYLLRLMKDIGLLEQDLVRMGEAISIACENDEVADVRTVIESTKKNLDRGARVSGGPALARALGEGGAAVIARIEEWLGRGRGLRMGPRGGPMKTQDNIRTAVMLMGARLSMNTFAEKMFIAIGDKKPIFLDDDELSSFRLRIDREFGLLTDPQFFYDVIRDVARENAYHPVVDWLATLEWDGTPRISTWLTRIAKADDDPYVSAVGRILLIAAVRRVRHPGCKYDEMLVLESEQGMNKSTALRTLCPRDAWFSDDLPLNVDAKQIIERTGGKWIIEASDLAGRRKAEVDHVKAMLSRQTDGPVRKAFGRASTERDRQFVLVGTANPGSYLADYTGSRRFWPVKVGVIDILALEGERDQLWAEAAAAEAKGEPIRLHESLWPAAALQQENRREADPWESAIDGVISDAGPKGDGKRRIATRDLWSAIGIPMERRDNAGSRRISAIMHNRGFRNITLRESDGVRKGYVDSEPHEKPEREEE